MFFIVYIGVGGCILCLFVSLSLFFIVYVVMGCMNFTELQTRELD